MITAKNIHLREKLKVLKGLNLYSKRRFVSIIGSQELEKHPF